MTQLVNRPTETLPEAEVVEHPTRSRRFGPRSMVIGISVVVGMVAGWMIFDSSSGLSPAEIHSARWQAVAQAYQGTPEAVAQVRHAALPAYFESRWQDEQAARAKALEAQQARFAAAVVYYETHWQPQHP